MPDQYVHLHWSGTPMSSAELRALYVHARNLLHVEGLHCILADHRHMPSALSEADQRWLVQQWLPETVADAHYSHCAVLPTLDPTHRLHTPPVVAQLQRHIAVALFSEPAGADAWLRAIH